VGVGNPQGLTVERGDETVEVEICWEALTGDHWRDLIIDFLVTTAFLGFGVWALFSTGSFAGLLLAVFGLSYAVTNLNGLGLGPLDPGLRFVQGHLTFFYTAILVHFLVVFPKPKVAFKRRIPGWLIYLPFLPFLVLGLAEWVVYPSLLEEYRSLGGKTDLLFMILALIALVHSILTVRGEERRASGFNLVLWGLAVSLGPPLALALAGMALPRFGLPGSEYLTLLGAAIPGGMALGVVRGARGAGGVVQVDGRVGMDAEHARVEDSREEQG
jgi:hypothetical protein